MWLTQSGSPWREKVGVEVRLEPGRWAGDANWVRQCITTTLPPFPPENCCLIFNKPDLLPPTRLFFLLQESDWFQGASRSRGPKIIGFTHLHQLLMRRPWGGKRRLEKREEADGIDGGREKSVTGSAGHGQNAESNSRDLFGEVLYNWQVWRHQLPHRVKKSRSLVTCVCFWVGGVSWKHLQNDPCRRNLAVDVWLLFFKFNERKREEEDQTPLTMKVLLPSMTLESQVWKWKDHDSSFETRSVIKNLHE